MTTWRSCSRCGLLSDRSAAHRQVVRDPKDLSVCGLCIRLDFEGEGRKIWNIGRLNKQQIFGEGIIAGKEDTKTMTPPLTVDQAVQAVTAAEATYTADGVALANIQANIATATAPLATAQSTLTTDTTAYIAALNNLSAAALAEIAALTPPASGS